MKILMVCLGNICRSPLAEGILQHKLGSKYVVESRGTIDFHKGKSPDKRSIAVAKAHGIDISNQKSRLIQYSDIENYQLVFAMDESNYKDILALCKEEAQKSKIKLLLRETGFKGSKNVPDPYYGTIKDFEKVYALLDENLEIIATDIKNEIT